MSMRIAGNDCTLPCGCHVKLSSLVEDTANKVREAVKPCGHAEHSRDLSWAMNLVSLAVTLRVDTPEIEEDLRQSFGKTDASFLALQNHLRKMYPSQDSKKNS